MKNRVEINGPNLMITLEKSGLTRSGVTKKIEVPDEISVIGFLMPCRMSTRRKMGILGKLGVSIEG